ncbi:hypothetical protein C8A05DRAFT_37142 [Staphylotrichum tortipilum]|uniref:Uncharacterized protein n=1 Tax=Staphylotrichum tortipilum TaxID=2831512 RepID=A0AAN6RQN6_9PEZI|nr:hypothetical protein C8A05DRAFT_37142 [Staphylotrichum longicolle]
MADDTPEAQAGGKAVPHLGSLPAELFDKILFETDTIRDLARFTATARFVYRRFTMQRQTVLFRVLKNELGPVLVDARFLYMFPYSDTTDHAEYISRLRIMADAYREMLRGGNATRGLPVQRDVLPSLTELTAICGTLHKINFIADMYATAQLGLFLLGGGAGTPATAPLSPLERQRVVRAFYRRQILSNAWAATGRPKHWSEEDTAAISNTSTHQGEQLGLFGALEPWELQHIEHANIFLERLCLALVHHCPRTTNGARGISPRQFDELFAHLHCLVRVLRTYRGIAKRAARDLPTAMEPAHCARLRDEYVNPYQMIPMQFAWQTSRAASFPDPVTDKWERDGLVVPYVGDGLDLVPYGWLDALQGRYVTWFGEGLHSIPWIPVWGSHEKSMVQFMTVHLWRYAGFSLWGRERVEALKGLSVFGKLYTGFVFNRLNGRDP